MLGEGCLISVFVVPNRARAAGDGHLGQECNVWRVAQSSPAKDRFGVANFAKSCGGTTLAVELRWPRSAHLATSFAFRTGGILHRAVATALSIEVAVSN